jgi:hypothetical protein
MFRFTTRDVLWLMVAIGLAMALLNRLKLLGVRPATVTQPEIATA